MLKTVANNSELTQELNAEQIKNQSAINTIPITKASLFRLLDRYFNIFDQEKRMLSFLQCVLDNEENNEDMKDELSALTYMIQGLDYMERGHKQLLKLKANE